MFASGYAAYEARSDGMKTADCNIAWLQHGRSDRLSKQASRAAIHDEKAREPQEDEITDATHPIVRTHPETGRRAYVSYHTVRFDGMTVEESAPLLNCRQDHFVRPEFTCRCRWEPGSLAIWDNRCTQHNTRNDYYGQRRIMHRVTIKGDEPV